MILMSSTKPGTRTRPARSARRSRRALTITRKVTVALLSVTALAPAAARAQSAHDPIPLPSETGSVRAGRPGASSGTATHRRRDAAALSAPRLVVLLVADQFRADSLTRFAADFGAGGFRRLLREGAVF